MHIIFSAETRPMSCIVCIETTYDEIFRCLLDRSDGYNAFIEARSSYYMALCAWNVDI